MDPLAETVTDPTEQEGRWLLDHATRNGGRPHLVAMSDGRSADDVDMLASWQEVDLLPATRGEKVRPVPTILRRSDGRGLFYDGQLNYLHGSDGTGKSFVAAFAAAEVITDGRHVVWLDWEDPDETNLVARMLSLGVPAATLLARLHYLHPTTEATPTAIAHVCAIVKKHDARLVVLDSVGEALGVDGANESNDHEVTPWVRRVLRPLVATGAAVLPIDHSTKSAGHDGAPGSELHPSGSKRKRAAVTGAHYLVRSPRPLSAEYGGGRIELTTAKDRHGQYTRGKVAAVIDVNIWPDGGWTYHVEPPNAAGAEPAGPAVDIIAARAAVESVKELAAELGHPPSANLVETRMREKVKAAATTKRAGIDYALAVGALTESKGPRNARLLTYVSELPDPARDAAA